MDDNSPNAPIDICNLSLTELKVEPIQSLDQQDSKTAELCKQHYDIVRKGLLRSHVWNFAKTEASLSRATDADSNSFSDVYPLPSSYLRLVSVGDVIIGTKDELFDVRSIEVNSTFKRCIVVDNSGSATLSIIYIRNVTQVSEFDPLFVKLFKYELAHQISSGITLKPSLKQQIYNDLLDARLEARSIDGQERPPVRISNSKFLNARKYGARSRQINTLNIDF